MSAFSDAIPKQVLDAYGIELDSAMRAASGLINRTWIVEAASAGRLAGCGAAARMVLYEAPTISIYGLR